MRILGLNAFHGDSSAALLAQGHLTAAVEEERFNRIEHWAGLPLLGRLAASLSAADLHAVVMGDAFVGIVHPSKIYNVLALGIPVLYIGPGA